MRIPKRLIRYVEKNFTGVMHTTLNPEGPGVVRIHLVPPRLEKDMVTSSVAIINGQDIIPVNVGWAIYLNEFIKQVNVYSGREINAEDTEKIMKATVKAVKKLSPFTSAKVIRSAILVMMDTFTDIAYGKVPDEGIEVVSLSDYAHYMRAPHRMDLLVSAMVKDGRWNCNQKCIHCYAAGQPLVEEQELTTEQWKTIIDKCKEACIPMVTFTGGEPTLREDLFELIEHAAWFVTRLNTNGIRLTREYCDKLMAASLDSCQITFYSKDEAIHNQLVGAPQYDSTLEGIKNALAAGLNISINTPLCSLNKDYAATLKFLKELGVTYVTCSGMIVTGNACTEASVGTRLTSEELKAVLKEAVDFCKENAMEISFTSPGWIEDEFFKELGINTPTCGACLSNMAITPAGQVVPCQSWLSEDALGNMLTDEWESIWDSEACKARRAYSVDMTGICPLKEKADSKKEVQ